MSAERHEKRIQPGEGDLHAFSGEYSLWPAETGDLVIEAGVALVDDTLVVAFMDSESGHTLELQRFLGEPDAQDQALGIDTYCLVVNGGPTYYGGIEAWRLGANTFDLELSELAASTLGVDRTLGFVVGRCTVGWSSITEALSQVLRPA